jgi:integrase
MTDLSKVGDRENLKPQREPHWQRVKPGCFLGFRPSSREGLGTWIARARDEMTSSYRLKALGDFGGVPAKDRFAAAQKEAVAFASAVESGGVADDRPGTVADACRDYAEGNAEVEGRFERHIYSDPVARVKLDKLRRHHLIQWRERLEAKPSRVSRNKRGEIKTRERAKSTVNRDMAVFRAALNKVLAPGTPGTEAAWQEALVANRNADGQRTLYLDRHQRKALLDHVGDHAQGFVRALCLLPLRPGALAALSVSDFDKRTKALFIGKDKNGKPRTVVLPPAAAALLAEQAKGKLPSAPLFMRDNGERWSRDTWKKPIAAAAAKAKLPEGTTAYTLRHSTITDLVLARLPLLTVARISGTSAEMIERHYGHLTGGEAVDALAGLTL